MEVWKQLFRDLAKQVATPKGLGELAHKVVTDTLDAPWKYPLNVLVLPHFAVLSLFRHVDGGWR